MGTDGDNMINAMGGNDMVNAMAGNDTVMGGTGNDSLVGGAGNDSLVGEAGNDTLVGDAGADILTGGAGRDDFFFADGHTGITVATADRITDFRTGTDEIFIDGGVASYDEVDGALYVDFADLVADVNAFFAVNNDAVFVAYNALGTGDAYVFFDADDSGVLDAGDGFVILSGVNLANEIASDDFSGFII
jgi:Ca2+-binding RTX toxin-like protein